MSFSDDEDFNDIYGDDSNDASNTTSTTTATTAAAEPAKSELTNDSAPASNSAETATNEGSAAAAPVSSGTSSLDQLAALQALSSNLNQLQQAANGGAASTETPQQQQQQPTQGQTSTQIQGQSNDTASLTPTGSSAPALPSIPSMPGMPGMPGMPAMPGMPNMQQWQQLQQLQQNMPQFQQAASQAAIQEKTNKADLSRDICKMFIGGLNWETTEDNLKDYFTKYGVVTDLKIMRDNATGRSRGFGFLTFAEASSVDEVVKTQHILDGKVIDPKRAIPREEQDKTGKIFVGGIGPDVRPKEFEEFFSQWGTIIDAQLMLDKDTGRSRGFGFITYDTPDAVDRVCENKFIEFKGKRIEIKRAEPRHLQKQMQQQKTQTFGGSSQFNMFQNPMMGSFNPMFNPQAMAEYYNKMQEYYAQMQQQTGVDYSQMYQQQMQQMQQMMGGMMPGMGAMPGMPSGQSETPTQESSDVPTIGSEERFEEGDDNGERDVDRRAASPPINAPRGPRMGGSRGDNRDGGREFNRDSNRDYNRDNSRDNGRDGSRDGNRGNYRSGFRNRGGRSGYRGGRSGYSRRNNNGYHPYST
ncbi:Hrp1p LALA0_S05e04786g [Lachancea lanzarotensis]|uniref:LALA0S05e04786g1_1 n=1 Tax=Lachancea lanzarotensis TaxID=1245769 RepID=A0A0C7MXH4_9SACH|nr:uncharacterized protein LALA0_S05e04786g [Lachancea lanzarotensis]CEP62399.1 LALA0S05e04786g1_1 [Lachancea lanzarotensis]